jgi:hypothetical protein
MRIGPSTTTFWPSRNAYTNTRANTSEAGDPRRAFTLGSIRDKMRW